MLLVGFETAAPMFEWVIIVHALDHVTTVDGILTDIQMSKSFVNINEYFME
jgi:hypothetical protein